VKLPVYVESETGGPDRARIPLLSASASRNDEGLVHLSLCNLDPVRAQETAVELSGFKPETVRGRIVTAGKMQDHNTFDHPEAVTLKEFSGFSLPAAKGAALKVTLPAKLVVTLELG